MGPSYKDRSLWKGSYRTIAPKHCALFIGLTSFVVGFIVYFFLIIQSVVFFVFSYTILIFYPFDSNFMVAGVRGGLAKTEGGVVDAQLDNANSLPVFTASGTHIGRGPPPCLPFFFFTTSILLRTSVLLLRSKTFIVFYQYHTDSRPLIRIIKHHPRAPPPENTPAVTLSSRGAEQKKCSSSNLGL